ncbi:ABC transporter permease [Wenzhouxiangella sp. AB-CW3]|uniref:ABC transporter permease n=1 Tax=Wenzhouxiangella sp. AB-CW3 TaxID=2771012 RepID=UPI00168AD950|nr:ABC transporter permease [Wenzhouxiangella sp. AB-CW3]QOC21911.1 ABC transporter permease [Wenzhouxiangella sp. AB-CW3]
MTPRIVRLPRYRSWMSGLPVLILGLYALAAVGVWLGLWSGHWSAMTGPMWAPPSPDHWLGTNRLGQDIFARSVAATATAFEIGLVVAVVTCLFGGLMGSIAGFFHRGWIDEFILWLTGTLEAIPFYLLVGAIAFALHRHPSAMYVAMMAAFWTTTARVVRAEAIRLERSGFILAARAGGSAPLRILRRHVLPNLAHVLLVQATLVFVAAIKIEVILSFLGLGVHDSISWGLMLAEAGQDILAGQYMNFVVASVFLFGLVMAGSLVADDLQDRLDPKRRKSKPAGVERDPRILP